MLNKTCWCTTQLAGRTTKTEVLKKAAGTLSWWCRGPHCSVMMTFFQVGEYKFWKDKAVREREPSSWKTRLNTHWWKHINKTLGKPLLGRGSSWHWLHLYQHMNRNHAPPCAQGATQAPSQTQSAPTQPSLAGMSKPADLQHPVLVFL